MSVRCNGFITSLYKKIMNAPQTGNENIIVLILVHDIQMGAYSSYHHDHSDLGGCPSLPQKRHHPVNDSALKQYEYFPMMRSFLTRADIGVFSQDEDADGENMLADRNQ